jgi:hypothetical protein
MQENLISFITKMKEHYSNIANHIKMCSNIGKSCYLIFMVSKMARKNTC